MTKRKLLFVINPISGGKDKKHVPELIKNSIDKKEFETEIYFTQSQGHATEIAQEAVADKFDIIAAVGGDGTVNEISRGIVNTDTALTIIPFGSGNGLARHLGVPMNIKKSIEFINNAKTKKIDCGYLNGNLFANMAGTGFDAHIGKLFAEQKTRGFSTYVKTTLNEFVNYKAQDYELEIDGKVYERSAFLISFANSTQYGNNAHIAPLASTEDGLIDVCIMRSFPVVDMPGLALRLFTKTVDKSKYVEIKGHSIKVNRKSNGAVHLDGEPFEMGQSLDIEVKPNSLWVLHD
ncbi:MAG: diacylglycerol kinase family protein [Cytophagales bacterium]